MHHLNNDYPLADEKTEVTEKVLSEYQFQIIEDNNFSLGKNKKFIPDLNYKKLQSPLSKLKTLFKFRATVNKKS